MRFDRGVVTALDGVSLSIAEGEFVAITGPSGCGKSTLLNLIGVLDQPTSGQIALASKLYSTISDASLFRRQHFGYVFQSFHLLPTLSALDNVLVPTIGVPGSKRDHAVRARRLLAQLGLERRLDHFPGVMSGGERQRVAIARALINDPKAILADEPTGSLDSATAAGVLKLLVQLQRERGLTLVIVTHDAAVSKLADRILPMRDGKLHEDSQRLP